MDYQLDTLLEKFARSFLTPLEQHVELYFNIKDALPEGALKRLFIRYEGYEPMPSMAEDWWNFYNKIIADCKPRLEFTPENLAVLFMWASRATFRMEA